MNTTPKDEMQLLLERIDKDFNFGGPQTLSEQIINDLKVLHPYIIDSSWRDITFDSLLEQFKSYLYPEGYIFLWRVIILSVVHALNVLSYDGDPCDLPPPEVASLSNTPFLDKYHGYPKQQRVRVHRKVFILLMVGEKFTMEDVEDLQILVAAKVIQVATKEEYDRVEKERLRRIGKEYGSMCQKCKNTAKSRMVCGRCKRVFYCGRKCQKAHWPEHKSECLSSQQPEASDRLLWHTLGL